jgi:hypothetical protein
VRIHGVRRPIAKLFRTRYEGGIKALGGRLECFGPASVVGPSLGFRPLEKALRPSALAVMIEAYSPARTCPAVVVEHLAVVNRCCCRIGAHEYQRNEVTAL